MKEVDQKSRKETRVLFEAVFDRATALRLEPRPYCQMSGSLPIPPPTAASLAEYPPRTDIWFS